LTVKDIFIEEKLFNLLFILRISPSLKGYNFVVEAVKRIIEDPSKKFNVRRRLYKEIGDKYNERENLIDRALRHAIIVSEKKCGLEEFEKKTNYTFANGKPTPRELLSTLSEQVRMKVDLMLAEVDEYLEQWMDCVM